MGFFSPPGRKRGCFARIAPGYSWCRKLRRLRHLLRNCFRRGLSPLTRIATQFVRRKLRQKSSSMQQGFRPLAESLCHHGFCYFEEAVDVCTRYVVAFCCKFLGCVPCVVVDLCHDVLEFCINFFTCP